MATSGSTSVKVTNYDTLKFTWTLSSQSVTGNSSVVSWKLQLIAASSGAISSSASKDWSVTVNGTKYSGTNTVGISSNTTKTLASGTTTIAHNSDGTKTFSYSFSQEFGITFSGSSIGTKSGSGSGTLTTIPRKSTLTASNGELGVEQTLTINRSSSAFTHTITYKCGDVSGTIVTKTSSTSIKWTPPMDLAYQNTTSSKVSITFTITTYNGSTSLGSNTKTISCSFYAIPTCEITHSDTTDYKSKYGDYVKGLSKVKILMNHALAYGSPILSIHIWSAELSYIGSVNNTTHTFTKAGTKTISASMTDARGRTGFAEDVKFTVIDYEKPTIGTIKVKRVNAETNEEDIQGTTAEVTINASISPLNNLNSATYYLEYKKTTETEYQSIELKEDRGNYNLVNALHYIDDLDTSSSYNIRVRAVDDIDEAIKSARLSTGFSLMHWLASGLGMALGKIAELEGVLDIGFKTRFMGGILHPTLEPETDLNDVLTPNTYVGANITTYNYLNAPATTGTFTLEVMGMGDSGQLKQRFSMCRKTDARVFERVYYQSSWGEWVCVSDYAGTLLWSGGKFMTADHIIEFTESASNQPTGIVLVFSEYYDGAAADQTFHSFFISKKLINTHSGKGHCFQMTTSNLSYYATKYLYIRPTGITGHANNGLSGTGANGITYTNNRFVLRYVIGV